MKNTESNERGSTTNQDTPSSGLDDSPCSACGSASVYFDICDDCLTEYNQLREWSRMAKAALEHARVELGKRGRPDPVDKALAAMPKLLKQNVQGLAPATGSAPPILV